MPSVADIKNTYSCARCLANLQGCYSYKFSAVIRINSEISRGLRVILILSVDVDRGGEMTLGLQLLNLIKYFEGWTQLESEAADDILAVEQQQGASINFLDRIRSVSHIKAVVPAKHKMTLTHLVEEDSSVLSWESLLHEVVHDIYRLPFADVGNGGVHGIILPVGRQQACVRVQVRGQQGEEACRIVIKGLLDSGAVGDRDP